MQGVGDLRTPSLAWLREHLGKRKQKECKSHSGWMTSRKQGFLNQMSKDAMSSQRRGQQASGSLLVQDCFQFSTFYGFPVYTNKWISVSCSFSWAPLLLLFLYSSCVLVFVLTYCVTIAVCFLIRHRKGVALGRGGGEELGGVEGGKAKNKISKKKKKSSESLYYSNIETKTLQVQSLKIPNTYINFQERHN